MDAYTSFGSENKLISLENKNCTTVGSRKKVTCTSLSSCLKYNGINLPPTIDIEISWVLDSKKAKTPRMFFVNDEGKNIRNSTMRLSRGKEECRQELVYVADGVRDKLTAIEVEMKYSIRQATTTYTASNVSRRRRTALEPVLDENRGTVQRDSINIMKNCGKDNICIPDLKLDVKTDDKYLLGANESLTVEVLISNFGEDAFEANFFMTIPNGLDYKSTRRIGEANDISYTCTPPSFNNALKCDIGNPLPAGKSVNFKVYMEPSKRGGKVSIEPYYEFYMEANSTNEEADGGQFDNVMKKNVAIFVESDLAISGSAMPSEFHYNVSQYKEFKNATHEAEIGPHVVHIYDIRNNGTSIIEEIEIFIHWPAETLNDEPLMYLMNQPETSGNVVCDQTQFVNMAGLQRDRVLEQKSFLDKNRSPIRQGEFGFSGSGGNRYNNQGGSTFDDRKNYDDSSEHSEHVRSKNGSYHAEKWHESNKASGSQSGNKKFTWKETQGGGSENRGSFNAGGSSSGGFNAGGSTSSGGSNNGGSSSSGSFNSGGSSSGGFNSGGSSSGGFNSGGSSSSGSFNSGGSSSSGFNAGGSSSSGGSNNGGSSSSGTFNSGGSSSSGSFNSGGFNSGGSSSSGSFNSDGSSSGGFNSGGSSSSNGFNSGGSSSGGFSSGGTKVREFETREEWNSTSVNGGPAVVNHASKNKTMVRGEDGKVVVSEVSTERTYIGSVGGRWEDHNSRVTQTQTDYEREQQEHYESQRRYQEEQRQRQAEERIRQQEAYRRQEEEKIRMEEERRRVDEERRRRIYESRNGGAGRDESRAGVVISGREESRTGGVTSGREEHYEKHSETRSNSGSNSGR